MNDSETTKCISDIFEYWFGSGTISIYLVFHVLCFFLNFFSTFCICLVFHVDFLVFSQILNIFLSFFTYF